MKNKTLLVILFLLFLTMVMTKREDKIIDLLLSLVNPLKQTYTNITRDIGDKSESYVYQKENIQRLTIENKFLRKRLLEQKHYVQQVKDLYKKIPSLERIPRRSVDIVQTISYVKLNSFSQIILTKPSNLEDNDKKLYGLIQNDVVAGVAQLRNNNLYASLISNKKCRFAVFVGEKKAAGIAMGLNTNEMFVKFIPKWAEIKQGDKVITNGLDTIFFANIPVGIVDRVKVESSYKIAYIKVYADVLKPDYFYLIKDATPTITSKYDSQYLADNNRGTETNQTINSMYDPNISSIPSILPNKPETISQTNDEEVTVKHPEPPVDIPEKVVKKRKKKVKKRRPEVENISDF